MSTIKRLNTPYTIQTTEVVIDGNLTVLGTQTTVHSTDTEISDNIFALNAGETGAGVTAVTSGIEIDRGSLANVALVWNETFDKWRATVDGITYANIVLAGDTGVFSLIQDLSPALGGNLNTNGYTIYSNVGNVKFNGNIQLNDTLVTPTAVTGSTVLYAAEPTGGASGVYVVNSTAANHELITKTRAFGLSLIL